MKDNYKIALIGYPLVGKTSMLRKIIKNLMRRRKVNQEMIPFSKYSYKRTKFLYPAFFGVEDRKTNDFISESIMPEVVHATFKGDIYPFSLYLNPGLMLTRFPNKVIKLYFADVSGEDVESIDIGTSDAKYGDASKLILDIFMDADLILFIIDAKIFYEAKYHNKSVMELCFNQCECILSFITSLKPVNTPVKIAIVFTKMDMVIGENHEGLENIKNELVTQLNHYGSFGLAGIRNNSRFSFKDKNDVIFYSKEDSFERTNDFVIYLLNKLIFDY